jgi:lysophospholipase
MLAAAAMTAPEPAPYLAEIAEGPEGARAWWVTSADGTRLRLGVWPAAAEAPRGTILLFPGRTEYIEKYGRVARDLVVGGFTVVAFDWRGQGLSDRPQHRRDMGHVTSFDEYREDVEVFRHALETLGLPGPYHLIAHSMGGAIGLRALHDGLPVKSAAFSAPDVGHPDDALHEIHRRDRAWPRGALRLRHHLRALHRPWQPMEFDDNPLTTDRDQFDYMSRQVAAHPELALGGPSVLWVKAALEETAALMKLPAPDIPTVTLVGTRESIVEVPAIESRMASWPRGRLITVEGGLHEMLMEVPDLRSAALSAITEHFAAAEA